MERLVCMALAARPCGALEGSGSQLVHSAKIYTKCPAKAEILPPNFSTAGPSTLGGEDACVEFIQDSRAMRQQHGNTGSALPVVCA